MVGPLGCARRSEEAREPIAGTATASVERWLVVESAAPWPRKGLPAAMSPSLRSLIETTVVPMERTRVVLARGSRPLSAGAVRFWIALASESERSVQSVTLEKDEDPRSLDLTARLEGRRRDGEVHQGLWLVCTHGQRDQCCARLGMPVYESLRAAVDDVVLRSSHLGGHRFAPTLVSLPMGVHFGRVRPDQVGVLAESVASGVRGPVAQYRGRTFLSRPAQAAVCFLHDHLSEESLDALTLYEERNTSALQCEVVVGWRDGLQRIRLEKRPHAQTVIKSCGEAPTEVGVWQVTGVDSVSSSMTAVHR